MGACLIHFRNTIREERLTSAREGAEKTLGSGEQQRLCAPSGQCLEAWSGSDELLQKKLQWGSNAGG